MPYPQMPLGLMGMLNVGGAGTIPGPGNRMTAPEQGFQDPLADEGPPEGLLEAVQAMLSGQGGMSGGTQGLDWDLNNLDLVTRNGVTLQPEAMQTLMQARKRFDIPILSLIGGSIRSLAQSQQMYNDYIAGRRSAPAAPPGKSYHNYGLAFDLSGTLPGMVQNWLEQHGWQNTVPGEAWHWSYGDAPWGGS